MRRLRRAQQPHRGRLPQLGQGPDAVRHSHEGPLLRPRQPADRAEHARGRGAGGGLYLPTKLFVFEDADGAVHVSYEKFSPIMAPFGLEALDKVAGVIDGVLEKLAMAAVS